MNVVDVLDGNKQSGLCFLAIIFVMENILNIANIANILYEVMKNSLY